MRYIVEDTADGFLLTVALPTTGETIAMIDEAGSHGELTKLYQACDNVYHDMRTLRGAQTERSRRSVREIFGEFSVKRSKSTEEVAEPAKLAVVKADEA